MSSETHRPQGDASSVPTIHGVLPITFQTVHDFVRRRVKHGKMHLKVLLPQDCNMVEIDAIGSFFAICPGFRSWLETSKSSSLTGREVYEESHLVIDWAPVVPRKFMIDAGTRKTPYVPAPVETTLFSVEIKAETWFGPVELKPPSFQ